MIYIYTLILYTSQHHPILQEIFHIQNLDFTWDWCNMQTNKNSCVFVDRVSPKTQTHTLVTTSAPDASAGWLLEPARLRSHGTWYISCIITHVFMHIYTHLYTSIHIYILYTYTSPTHQAKCCWNVSVLERVAPTFGAQDTLRIQPMGSVQRWRGLESHNWNVEKRGWCQFPLNKGMTITDQSFLWLKKQMSLDFWPWHSWNDQSTHVSP